MSSNLHTLKPAKGSTHRSKRIGRGEGSKKGGTSTKGHKGQQSRSGYSRKRHFEGGQTPIQMRVPKRGFKNHSRIEYRSINLKDLEYLSQKHNVSTINFDFLRKIGWVQKNDLVKVLGSGDLKTALSVSLHAFSKSAKEAIENLGGTAEATFVERKPLVKPPKVHRSTPANAVVESNISNTELGTDASA